MREFLDQIFAVELSQTLIKALEALVTFIPTLLKEIQLRLINVLSTALRQQPFAVPDTPSSGSSKELTRSKSKRENMGKRISLANVKKAVVNAASGQPADKKASSAAPSFSIEEEKAPETIALALKTLGTFNLTVRFY
jgi:hypothetical protein